MTRVSTVPSPMPASNTRTAGGSGCRWASSRPTRRATISFSLQVLTNSRYFWRLSKKRKLREGAPSVPTGFRSMRGMPLTRSSCISSRGAAGASAPWLVRKALTRSSVSGVMRAPSRRRETNLPSLTARRPKVDSAMPARRQNSEMLSSNPTAAWAIARAPWQASVRAFSGPVVVAKRILAMRAVG